MANPGPAATNYTVVQTNGLTESISGSTVVTLMRDENGDILIGKTTQAPNTTINGSGFAKGCILIKTDVATGTGAVYLNKGTNTLAVFSLVTQA